MHLTTLSALVTLTVLLGFASAAPYRCTYVFYYQPVCGIDGKTYINMGHLTCESLKRPGLVLKYEGACSKEETTTVTNLFSELDNEANDTVPLNGVNVTLESLEDSLAKLNISLDEMRTALKELNMTLDELSVSPHYLDRERLESYPVGYYGYDRIGRPYGRNYGYGSDEFGDLSIEFGFGSKKVSRLLLAAAIAGAVKHQMDKKHMNKYKSVIVGGSGSNWKTNFPRPSPFKGSSLGAPPAYGWKNTGPGSATNYKESSMVKPVGHGYPKQNYNPVKPDSHGYPKQNYNPVKPDSHGYPKQNYNPPPYNPPPPVKPVQNSYPKQPTGVVNPPPYSPYKPPPPYNPTYQQPKPKPNTGYNSGSSGGGYRPSSSGGSKSGGRRGGSRGGGRRG